MYEDDQNSGERHLRRIDGSHAVTVSHRQLVTREEPVQFDDDDDISLHELWLTIRKYKWTILSFTALVVGAAIIGTALMRPVYKSTATIQINPDTPRILEYQNLENNAANAANQRNFYSTQYGILNSRSLAKAVIKDLGLMDNPEINGEMGQRGIIAGLGQLVNLVRSVFASGEADTPEAKRDKAVDRFLDRLTVTPVRDSKLVHVSFESFNPELSSKVANSLVQEYIKANLQRHYDAGSQARDFLKTQLADMQAKLERADQSLQDFARRQGVADLEDNIKLANDKLASLQQKLTDVQQQKIELQVKDNRIKAGKGDSLPEIVNSDLISKLQQELVQRRAEYAELMGTFKPQYPTALELKSRIDQLQQQIKAEKQYIQDSIVDQYQDLSIQEKALESAIQRQQQNLLELNQSSVQYNILKRDVDTNNELYNGLLQRMKEIGVAAGVRENNVAVIDSAQKALRPFKPSMRFNALVALLFGCFGGTGLAFFLQFLDNTVRRPEDIEALVDLPSLGLVPHAREDVGNKQARELEPKELAFYSLHHRHSQISEAYRSLRTSLTFSSPDGMPRTLLVTSTGPGEGKTTTSSNLACVLAQNGKRTLLIDADLRKAQLHHYYEKPQVPGLTQRIARKNQIATGCVHETDVENLYVMTSGTIPPNPAEMLAPERVSELLEDLAGAFDHVIIDSAPVLGLADALVLSRSVEGVMLIVYGGKTTKEALRFTVRRLRQVHAPLVGVILNNIDLDSPDYNHYSSSYYYSYTPDQTGEPLEELEAEEAKRISGESA